METVIGGLIVAAVTGLSFIAYKHPTGYGRIFFVMSAMFAVAGFTMFGWNFAVASAAKAAANAVGPEKATAATQAVASLATPTWLGIGLLALALYANFLAWLPQILKERD